MPPPNKGKSNLSTISNLSAGVVNPETGLVEFPGENTPQSNLSKLSSLTKGPIGVNAAVRKGQQTYSPVTPYDFDANAKENEYTTNPNPKDDGIQFRAALTQPTSERWGRAMKQFGANMIGAMAQSAINTTDIQSSLDIISGKEQDFNSTLFGISTNDIMDWTRQVQENNPVYEQRPGEFNPGDGAWWANQVASSGTGIGMGLYALGETALISAATEGLGFVPELMNQIRKVPQLLRIAKSVRTAEQAAELMNIAKNLKRTATTYAIMNRLNESKMEAQQTFQESYGELLSMKNEDGSPKYTEQEARQFAAKGAIRDFQWNLPLMALDVLTYRTMVFNPISGKGVGLLEKGFEKVADKIGKNMIGKAAAWSLPKVVGMASEGAEEGLQFIGQEEGEHYARVLAGMDDGSSFTERLGKNVQSDEFWNNFAGGVIGSPIIGGTMNLVNKAMYGRSQKRLNNLHKDFITNVGRMDEGISSTIRDFESQGNFKEAETLRRQFGVNKSLSALHLDSMKGSNSGFESLINFYQETLGQINEGKIDNLQDLGFTNPTEAQVEKIKTEFGTYIEDANKMKSIYDKVSNQYNKNFVPEISRQQFNLENLISERNNLSTQIENDKNSLPQYSELSSNGKEVFNLINENLVIDNEINRLKGKEGVSAILKGLTEKKNFNSNRISEINKEETYQENTKEEDENIINSMVVNNDYISKLLSKTQIDSQVKLQRDKLAKWNNPKYQEERLNEIVRNTKDSSKLEDIEESTNNTSTKEEIQERKVEANAKEVSSNTVNPFAGEQLEEETSINEIKKQNATGLSAAIESATTPAEASIGYIQDDELFEPNELKSNLSDDVLEPLRNFTRDYTLSLGEDLKRTPSFEDFVRDYIKTQGREVTDRQYNGLVKGWELNGFTPANYSQVYNQIFRDRKEIGKSINDTISSMLTEEEVKQESTSTVIQAVESESVPDEFDLNNQPVYYHIGFRTHETQPKFAFSTRLSEAIISGTEEANSYLVNYEYTSDELNEGQYVKSLKLLDPDKYIEGTKLSIKVPDNFEDILVPIYNNDGTKGKAIPFGQYARENNLTPDMKEYQNKIPMIIYDDEGDGVAFVHDADWYHPIRFNETVVGQLVEARQNTVDIRNQVNSKGSANIVITSKRNTTFEGLVIDENKPLITINEANPQSVLAIADSLGNLRINEKDNFSNASRVLINKKSFTPGRVYDIRRFGRNQDGTKTYVALPVHHPKINQESLQTINEVIGLYLNQFNPTITPEKRKHYDNVRDQVLSTTNLDLHNPKDFESFIGQFIPTLKIQNTKDINDIVNTANTKLKVGQPYIAVQYSGGNLVFGIVGTKMSKNSSAFSLGPNFFKGNQSAQGLEFMQNGFKQLRDNILPKFNHDVSLRGLTSNKPVMQITASGVSTTSNDYQSYVKGILTSNVRSHNIGTEDNPNYVTNIQPVITYESESKLQEYSNENIKQETIDNATAITEEAKEVIEKPVDNITQEEANRLQSEAEEQLKWLGDIQEEDDFLDPVELTNEQVNEITSSVTRIAGLTPSQQNIVTDFIFNQISMNVDFDNREAISKSEIDSKIKEEYDLVINPIKEDYQERKNKLEEIYNSNPSQFPNLIKTIRSYELALNKIKAIEDSFGDFKEQAQIKINKYTGITETEVQEDESQMDDLLGEEDSNERDQDFSSEALQEDGKTASSYRLKRFFAGIRDYDKNGQPKTSFLNLPMYIGFDTVYNTVSAMLAEAPADYNLMVEKLESLKDNYKWIPELISKLNNSSQQLKNELVSTMSKHSLNMEFVMYGYDRKTGNYSLKVFNTNANSIVQVLQREWFNNFKTSPLVVSSEGVYEINTKRAEHLLDVFNQWTSKDYEVIENKNSLTTLAKKIGEVTPSKGVPVTILEPNLKKEIEDKLNIKDRVVFNYGNKDYTFSKTKGQIWINSYKGNSINPTEIKSWLSDFGIQVSDDTITELMTKGMYDSSSKEKILFSQMFHKSDNSKGLFGVLAHQLETFINKGNVDIEEEGGNPLDNTVVKKLAKIESKYNMNVISNSFRDNGKSIYGFTVSKYITDRVKGLVTDENLRDQLSKISFSKNSLWLHLLNTNPDFLDKFQISHMGLNAFKEMGKQIYREKNGITNLSDADHELTKKGMFEDMNQGTVKDTINGIEMRIARMFSPTMSDKSTMTVLKTAVLNLQNKDLANGDGISDEVVKTIYEQIVKPELERILNFYGRVKETNTKSYDKGAGMFFFIPKLNEIEVDGYDILTFLKGISEKDSALTLAEDKLISNINDLIRKQVDSLVNQKINVWTENGYIGKDKKGNDITKFIDSKYLNKFQGDISAKVKMAAMDFVVNNLISNANSFMLISGDPANYYKTEKRNTKPTYTQISKDTFVNVGKRLANQIAPGIKLADSENNQYIQLFLKDRKSISENIDYLERLLGKEEANNYRNIEGADAQEYTTWKEHLYILEKLGRSPDITFDVTPEEIREAREIFSSNRDLKSLSPKQKKIIKKIMQPIKPVYTGQIYDSKNDNMRVVYIKSSSFPLIPQLTKGMEIDNLRVAMESLERKEGKTVRASYQTANKVGAVNNAVSLWNEDGRAKVENLETNKLVPSEELNTSALILNRKDFRIQQDVPFKSYKKDIDMITLGTQTMKLLFGDGVLNLDGFEYNGEKKTGKGLHKIYNDLFIDLISNKRSQLYNQLGIDEKTNQPIEVEKTMTKLQSLLREEAINRGYPKQDIQSLNLSYKKDSEGNIVDVQFTLPLWASANSNRFESLLNAIVTNRLIKVKFPGNYFVVGSEEGFKFKTDLGGVKENKIVFTSKWTGNLKAAEVIDGKLSKAQVLLPSKFRDSKGNIIDFTSPKYSSRDENGVLRLKEDMIDKELLSLTSFRIPTSGHVSMAQIEIVGFLPEESGDLLIVPRNFTKQMGLDFDIDKQNTYSMYHTTDEDGKIKVLNNEEETEKMIVNNIVKVHNSILSNPSDEMQRKINKTLSIDYAKSQAALIDNVINDSNPGELFTPLSDEYQKQKMFLGASGKIGTGAYSLDVVGHSLFQQANLNGNALRLREVVLDEEEKAKLVNKEFRFGKYTSNGILGMEYTLDGSRTISEVLAELQNIAVDNEKEQVMGRVNLNDLTLDVSKVFAMLGFDKGEDGNSIPFLFLSQPIIRDYVKLMKNANSNIAEFDEDKESKILTQLHNKYGSINDVVDEDYWNTVDSLMTNTNLLGALKSQIPDGYLQGAVLRRFMEMKSYGEALRKLQTSINTDSKGLGKSTLDVLEKFNNLNDLYSNTLISNTDKLIGDYKPTKDLSVSQIDDYLDNGYYNVGNYLIKPTTLSGAFNVMGISSAYHLWTKYFPYNSTGIGQVFDELLRVMDKDDAFQSKRIELRQDIFKEMKKYLFSNRRLNLFSDTPQEERRRLFMDSPENTSLANYLRQLRQLQGNRVVDEYIKFNKLINKFELSVQTNGQPSLIKFNNAASESFDEEYMYNSFVELIEKPITLPELNGKPYNTRLLAQDLVAYAYLEGGIQQAIQFVKYVPVSYLNSLGFSNIMSRLDFNLHNIFDLKHKEDGQEHLVSRFTMQYAQHNPQKMTKLNLSDEEGKITWDVVKSKIAKYNKEMDIKNLNTLQTFELINNPNPPGFLSIYNAQMPKAEKKFQLYWFDGSKYVRVPVLGIFGMSEYDMKGDLYSSLVNGVVKSNPEPQGKVVTPIEVTEDVLDINSGNLENVLNNIISQDIPYLSNLVKELIPYIDSDTKIVVEDMNEGRGKYNRNSNTITLSSEWILNSSTEEIARTIAKEFVHSITSRELGKYLNDDGSLKVANAPAYILRLQRLFRQAEKHFGPKLDELRRKNKKDGFTQEEKRVTYGAYDIMEFVEMIMTQPEFQQEMNKVKLPDGETLFDKFKQILKSILESIGVNFDEDKITFNAINSVFELVENERKVSPNPIINPFGNMLEVSNEDIQGISKILKEDNMNYTNHSGGATQAVRDVYQRTKNKTNENFDPSELIDILLQKNKVTKNCP